ncbi:MAG: host attachment protein [Hydrogenophaga sp.]|uniref:host attachment protein n=1 Tax=Hydrogenophaga sp. TaxID=1904254 RepID=UPI00272003FD|nr:host attachment protein [Hydrogenophaga sp.]MDO8888581.1 host attachment protein [Hydrogenophaga sp.]MDP2251848.1 host attachment protein [Hydrogenophaga sp.]MDZ4128150.1 host attachment protein [Hydrogenophaga sp.]
MRTQWILVANGSLARFFSRHGTGDPLVPLETIDFPEGRLKGSELERDRHGHESSDNSTAAAHFEPHTGLRKKLLHQFARELAERLEEGLVDREYDALWVTASSPFLGELKAALHPGVAARIQWLHDADLTALDVGAIETRLRDLTAARLS